MYKLNSDNTIAHKVGTGEFHNVASSTEYLSWLADGNTPEPADITAGGDIPGQLAGFRNKIINGACNVQQRAPKTLATVGSPYGSVDRFFCGVGSAVGSISLGNGEITHENAWKNIVMLYVDTATTATFTGSTQPKIDGFSQKLECNDVYDLRGKTITISFLFNTNVAGRYSFCLQLLQVYNSYADTFDVGVGTTKVSFTLSIPTELPRYTVPTDTMGLGGSAAAMKLSIGGLSGTIYGTPTLKSWVAGEYVTATGPLLGLTNWANTAGNYIALTELQLETGSVATPFEQRPYATELALCQRYYEVIGGISVGGYHVAGNAITQTLSFSAKRIVPSIAVVTAGSYTNGSGLTIINQTYNATGLYFTVTATGAAQASNWALSFSAEL